jgi:predicted TIM-barrel fold metal-dependent hydrolase
MSDKVLLVSSDGHAGVLIPDYREYLEARYYDDFDEYVREFEEQRPQRESAEQHGGLFARRTEVTNQCRWADSAARLEDLEENGVVVEVLFPGVNQESQVPWSDFFTAGRWRVHTPRQRELKQAGERAYNRWLAEFCADTPGRRVGLAFLPYHDVEAALAEIEWAAGAGIRGVLLPAMNYDAPEYTDNDYWEPIWAACAEAGFSLNGHGGCGLPDWGSVGAVRGMEHLFFSSRPLWHLIFSGVFDRHPNLHWTLTEAYAAWVPDTLSKLDSIYYEGDPLGSKLSPVWPQRKPSEYWGENLFVGTSLVSLPEIEARHEIGVDSMMYGIDYPHPEGNWGQARTWMQASLGKAGITEDEARAILGLNAVRCYDLDLEELTLVAERVGPTVDEVLQVASDDIIEKLLAESSTGGRGLAVRNYDRAVTGPRA